MLDLGDQVIVLHEAAVAALVKTYAIVATHPTRQAVELESRRLPKRRRKFGYAEWQLLETREERGGCTRGSYEAMEARPASRV